MKTTATRGTDGRRSANEIANGPPTLADTVKAILWDRRRELAQLFPKDGETAVNRAIVMAMAEARKLDPKGDKGIDAYSVAENAVVCMKLDIEPGDDCYFVPFRGRVTLITSPRGLIKLGMRSGFVRKVSARAVVDGDEFEFLQGSEEYVKHRGGDLFPQRPAEMWKAITHAYATVETTMGGTQVEVLSKARLEYYRSKSPSKDREDSLWNKFPWEACRKTALKQVFNLVPRSAQMSIALRENEEHEGVQIPDEIWDALRGAAEARLATPTPEQDQQAPPESQRPDDAARGAMAGGA